jgi:hypothetical protein
MQRCQLIQSRETKQVSYVEGFIRRLIMASLFSRVSENIQQIQSILLLFIESAHLYGHSCFVSIRSRVFSPNLLS